MSQLETIRNEAEDISRAFQQKIIRVEALCSALFHDREVKMFFDAMQMDTADLESLNGPHILVDFSPAKQINGADLPLSQEVKGIFDLTNEFLEKHSKATRGMGGIVALYFLMRTQPQSKSAALLSEKGISSDKIGKYIHEINLHLNLSAVDKGVNAIVPYEYVIPEDSESYLAVYTTCLNDLAYEEKLSPTIGREDEIASVIRILRRKTKSNPILLGEAGVGKTAIAEGLAQMAVRGELPHDIKDLKIFNLDLTELVAGTTYRGDFEKRLKKVIEEIQDIEGALLFVDEFHLLVGAGRAGGAMDASNILKPALARGEIACMGATTYDEYRRYIAKDDALARRFSIVDVVEPSVDETYRILVGIRENYELFHDCVIPDDVIKTVVDLSARYITDRRLPDKAIDVLDVAGAILREIPWDEHEFNAQYGLPILNKAIVEKAVAHKTGLPLDKITASDRARMLSLKDALNAAVYGQEEAVEAVSDAYIIARSGIGDHNKPIGSFLFAGPTGVGKSELAKQLAHHLDMPLIRLDMSEYMERHSVSRLVGAPPGYVGYNDGGALTEPVYRQGHSVVLLDEIEKAHPDVYNVLLQVMDGARLTDAAGRTVDFKNTILILTSNAGAGGSIVRSIGFGREETRSTKAGEIEAKFTPEFRNRLDAQITFQSLNPEILPSIVRKIATDLTNQLAERKISLSLTTEAMEWLAAKGFDDEMGARPLKRLFERVVKKPIAYKILESNPDETGGMITVSKKGDGLAFDFHDAISNDNDCNKVTAPALINLAVPTRGM